MCLSGASEFASGVKKISFKHDGNQSAAGGTTNQHEKINIDDDGAMKFGPNNKYEITFIIAKSPIVQEGEEEEGLLNEFRAWLGGAWGKIRFSPLDTNDDFIEVALHENIQNLNDYRISLYDGADGTVYQTITLDQFTVGTTVNSRVYYFYNMPDNTMLTGPAGISISYSGTVLPGQFISYGGSFIAVEGDATGKTSVNVGTFTPQESFALTGTGSKFSDFNWASMSNPSPGDANPGQAYTLDTFSETLISTNYLFDQNYPNPFNPNTTIGYSLPVASHVNIVIYDMLGRQVNQLISSIQPTGNHLVQWNGTDNNGNPVSAGIYFYHIQADDFVQTKKMVLLK